MVTSDVKALPHVRLHPVHFVGCGAPVQEATSERQYGLKPLRPGSSSRKCRKDELMGVLQDVIDGMSSEISGGVEQATPETNGHQVFLSSTCMVIDNGEAGCLSIPLQFADVVEAVLPRNQGASYVVALAPYPGVAGPLQDVWAFLVSCDSLELKRLLFDLGGRGAVRWDLLECYTLARKPLGEGGYGRVFLGQSVLAKNFKKSERKCETLCGDAISIDQVAVKLLNAKTEEESMRREIDFLIRSRGHPNVVSLHGLFCDFDRRAEGSTSWFIVMELCSCGDLFDHVSGGVLNSKECSALMKGLSAALDHLHQLRIVHRDVKPENVLMGAHTQPVLADMGVAAHLDDAIEMAKLHGSPGYAAPELLESKRYNELVDIFSAGCVYYFALSFQKPFRGTDKYDTLQRTIACKVRYPHRYFHHVSCRIINLMKICLSKDPKQRPSARRCIESLSRDATDPLEQHHCADRSSSAFAMDSSPSSGETGASQAAMLSCTSKAEPEAAPVESPPMVLPSTPDEPASACAPQGLLPIEASLQPGTALVPSSPMLSAPSTPADAHPSFQSLLPTQPTSPTEHQRTAHRAGSIPSRIKRCLMPSEASRWMAGAFRRKASSRVADDPGSSSSSSGAGEYTPKPPSSASPSKKTFRSFSLRRPKVMGM